MPSRPREAWRAPGRVNIIGEHIDYLGGTVLPFACNRELLCTVEPAPGEVDLTSSEGHVRFELGEEHPPGGWGSRVWAVARTLAEAGLELRGVRGEIRSQIPVGAGLSSSAALGAAVALALTGGLRPDPRLLQQAEQLGTGVPCGVMDQTAVVESRRGKALLLDCSTGQFEQVPIPESLGFVVVDTGTRRQLDDGRYATRRAEAEEGRPARLRHARSEQARVHSAAEALAAGDAEALGVLLDASHASLRDDFEVSSQELEQAVSLVRSHASCHGARLLGGGFAGCALALADGDAAGEVAAYASSLLPGGEAFVVRAVDGAGASA